MRIKRLSLPRRWKITCDRVHSGTDYEVTNLGKDLATPLRNLTRIFPLLQPQLSRPPSRRRGPLLLQISHTHSRHSFLGFLCHHRTVLILFFLFLVQRVQVPAHPASIKSIITSSRCRLPKPPPNLKMSSDALDVFKAVPLPSIDRPFGVHLWPIFDKAFTAIKGYHPQDFDFQPRVTPMSTMKESALTIVTYYIVIFGGRELMRNRPAFKLNGPFMIHNFYLTAISATLLALFVEQLVPTVYNHGIFYAICDVKGGWTPPLVILYYVGVCAADCR